MANNIATLVAEKYSSTLQSVLREAFVGKMITTTRFEWDFDGNDTVHFPRLTPIVVNDLATSYSNVTVQDVVSTDETFVLDTRKHFAFSISDEDFKEMKINPQSRAIQDWAQGFAEAYDDKIMTVAAAGAGIAIDDGNMETATNGGAGNGIVLANDNVYDLITAVSESFDTANVPGANRWLMVSPTQKRLLAKAPELLRSTDLGDKVVTWGVIGTIDDITIYYSNNLPANTLLAWQGKVVDFAANIKPKVQITTSNNRDSFTNLVKAQTKFGAKVFTENAERLATIALA